MDNFVHHVSDPTVAMVFRSEPPLYELLHHEFSSRMYKPRLDINEIEYVQVPTHWFSSNKIMEVKKGSHFKKKMEIVSKFFWMKFPLNHISWRECTTLPRSNVAPPETTMGWPRLPRSSAVSEGCGWSQRVGKEDPWFCAVGVGGVGCPKHHPSKKMLLFQDDVQLNFLLCVKGLWMVYGIMFFFVLTANPRQWDIKRNNVGLWCFFPRYIGKVYMEL